MELCNPKIKTILIFSQQKAFLRETETPKKPLFFRKELAKSSYFPVIIEKGKDFTEFIRKSPYSGFSF